MDNHHVSVYNLITKLCEKYSNTHQNIYRKSNNFNVKTARSQCYEILLSKKISEKGIRDELENNSDPACHLLAWQYQLMTKYSLPQHAEKLRTCCEKLQELNVFSDMRYTNLIMFLLQLRNVPAGEDTIMETTLDKDSVNQFIKKSTVFAFFDESRFQLPLESSCGSAQYDEEHFKLRNKKITFKTTGFGSAADFLKARQKKLIKYDRCPDKGLKDEGYESPSKSQEGNIWELVSHQPPNEHRTWEAFGCPSPLKELPFLCESGPRSTMWLQSMSTHLENLIMENYNHSGMTRKVITLKQFVKDVKYLLVGMQSKTFTCSDAGQFSIVPGICLEGLGPGVVESYCKDLLFCSSCYKGLNNLCTPDDHAAASGRHNGYIFTELCESIRRYLSYYRIAVLSISDSSNLLLLHERTRQLRTYVTVLASVCKVGPFMESGEIPHGVALLNYLYQKVMSLTNTDILMVLYSVLYPCCQVYFSRFLQQWILEGTVHDPYGEFFINVHPKYTGTRGRTYWTRSYTLREDIVPDFITDLRTDILLCGKAMNLLKICVPNSPLCLYLMDKRPDIISCCLMAEQLLTLEQNNYYYYLEATAVCGPRISLSQVVMCSKEEDVAFLNLIAKKRVATLNRIDLQRKRELERQHVKRQTEITLLREQYAEALKQKEIRHAEELEEEIATIEKDIRLQTLHDRIVQEEATNLMGYYNKLFEASESRRKFFEKRIQELKSGRSDTTVMDDDKATTSSSKSTEDLFVSPDRRSSNRSSVSGDFHSVSDLTESKSEYVLASAGNSSMNINFDMNECVQPLDIINANSVNINDVEEKVDNQKETTTNSAYENFKIAQKNKAKVLAQEMGIIVEAAREEHNLQTVGELKLTDAQRNKLKVMSSEFGLGIKKTYTAIPRPFSILEINRNRMMATSECFLAQPIQLTENLDKNVCDNENFTNKNVTTETHLNDVNININVPLNPDKNSNVADKWVTRKQDVLSLDFTKLDSNTENTKLLKPAKGPKFELEKVSPMSIDSTPLSGLTTPSTKLTLSFDRNDFEVNSSEAVTATTANTNYENAFKFEMDESESYFNFENRKSVFNIQTRVEGALLSKTITKKDTKAISSSCLKLCLQQSISIPLTTQIKLVTNELLKYFINDLQYLKHLHSLRNYFFLLDGEFGRNITEGLFKKLYDANFPMELINCHTLQVLVFKAMDYSTKFHENSECLSFRINNLPKIFDLGDPDVFDCISLTYKTGWPLNILLPSDTIGKYDEVFKFLLKLHRVSWVLQNVFQDLKSLVKEAESNKTVLMMSPQYRRLHQCRHVMTHFIQTLQSYVVGEVLQSSWEIFEKNLESVINFDQMYALHTNYIKNILFMCLLNQKSAPLRKVLHKIFIVILKFYDYLRSRSWKSEGGVYTHPNFKKLEDIFSNFEDLVLYLFKVGHKVVKSGYQPHLMQLLDMLDINTYYSKRNADISSSSVSSR